MTGEQPRLGVLSDEIDRLRDHIDEVLHEERAYNDRQRAEQDGRTAARMAETKGSIDAMNTTLTSHNGRLSKMEKTFEYMRGVKDGAGGSWHVLVGVVGGAVAMGMLAVAVVALGHHW